MGTGVVIAEQVHHPQMETWVVIAEQHGNRDRGSGRGPPFGMSRGIVRPCGPRIFVRVMMMCSKDIVSNIQLS